MEFYNIAGLVTTLECSGRTAKQALPYRIDPTENIDIMIPTDRIQRTLTAWKKDYPDIDDEMLEYMATGALFYLYLLQHNGMMLHSSAVVVDGKAYLFSADPGTGKSTHTRLWLEYFGDRAFILNDDKPALRLENGKWYAYGTPWSGKDDISKNFRAEIAGIAVLERGESNSISRFDDVNSVFALLAQVNNTKKYEDRLKEMELMDSLMTTVPIWKLKCNMDPEAAIVAYRAMSQPKGDSL